MIRSALSAYTASTALWAPSSPACSPYYNGTETQPLGLFYGGGFHFLGIQILGVVAVIAWVAITMTIVFNIIKHTIGLRVSEAEEIMGLDKPEHGLSSAYADFMPVVPTVLGTKAGETRRQGSRIPLR